MSEALPDQLKRILADIGEQLTIASCEGPIESVLTTINQRIGQLVKHERSSMQAAETLRIASIELTKNLNPTLVLEALLDYLCWLLPYDYASVSLLDEYGNLVPTARRDFRADHADSSCLSGGAIEQDSAELARQAIAKRKTLTIHQPAADQGDYHTRLIIPLSWESSVLGIIFAERCSNTFSEEQVHYGEALASQSTVAIHNAQLFDELSRADRELVQSYDATIEGWSRALELRDHDTEGHTLRVTELTLQLATHLGTDAAELIQIRRGSLLHDIGKVAIPDAVLLKPEPLNLEERRIMEMHPEYARQMLQGISYLQPALDIPYCHHERWDGTGYPRGLKETAIPRSARIFSVVDVWDALIHDRPYHKAWTQADVKQYIREQAGIFFDPAIVDAFLEILD